MAIRTSLSYHPAVPVLLAAVGLSLVGNIGGMLLGALLLLLRDSLRAKVVPWLISYAVGTLLAVALLELVPEALETLNGRKVFGTLLFGILVFFALEKLVLWRHVHADQHSAPHVHGHDSGAAPLILAGGAVHNFADGAMIGAAVLTSIPLGVSAALAVAAHQVPQEVSDFAILLGAGYSRGRAFLLNFLTGLTTAVGAIFVYVAAGQMPRLIPYVLAFAAGSFLYVAMADLIPGLHRGSTDPSAFRQIVLIALGIGTILAI